jgi:hypothetical protein
MESPTKKYFNRGQIESMVVAANKEFIIASRAFGKSEGIDAPRLLRNTFAMPGSQGALLSPTYKKLLQNTLPPLLKALSRLGYKRDTHYVLGGRPDKKKGFQPPITEVLDYDYSIVWFNGSVQNLISFDRSMSVNSMSLDYIMGFEAKYLDYGKIKDEVLPAIRGNRQYFGQSPWHHGMTFTTDMPTLKSGMWILDKAKDVDPDLIEVIKHTYVQIIELKTNQKDITQKYFEQRLKELREDLATFRKIATFYAEYDIFENIEIVGEKYVRDRKRELPKFQFRTAILNMKPGKLENCFYSALNESIHCYESSNQSYLESLTYHTDMQFDCRSDGDLHHSLPLCIGIDYNAAINSLVVGQVQGRKLMTLKSMFVKSPRKLPDVVNDFCDYYAPHAGRDVIFYYDATSIHDTPLDQESFKDTVVTVLSKRGWSVIEQYIGKPIRHDIKHSYIDMALKGDTTRWLFPQFNKSNCEALLVAMENAGVIVGRDGFQKDKKPEKKPETQELPEEYKTHITDAWDTLFIGCNLHPAHDQSSMPHGIHIG